MDDDQEFCLRWNNHQKTLVTVFDKLFENEKLVDCTLAAEGKFLKAHKVVLSACSPYFATLLAEQYDKHPIFILKDIKFQELRAMVNYMYRGEVKISQDQLVDLLKAAETLQIKGLSNSVKSDDESESDANKVKSGAEGNKRPFVGEISETQEDSAAPVANKRKKVTARRKSSAKTTSLMDPQPKSVSTLEAPKLPIVNVPTLNENVKVQQHNENSAQTSKIVKDDENPEVIIKKERDDGTDTSVGNLTIDDEVMDAAEIPPQTQKPEEVMDITKIAGLTWEQWNERLAMPLVTTLREGALPLIFHKQTKLENQEDAMSDSSSVDGGSSNAINAKNGTGSQDEGGFSCPDCNRNYKLKSSLRNHQKWECGKEPQFQCPYCAYKAKQKMHIGRHMERMHKDKIYKVNDDGKVVALDESMGQNGQVNGGSDFNATI